jgi:hypothetical protein
MHCLAFDYARTALPLTTHALPQPRRWYFGWAKYAALVLVSAGVVVCERLFIAYARTASAPALVFWLSKIRSSGAGQCWGGGKRTLVH